MTPRDFCYWLQGYMETENPETIDATKTKIIKDHLNLVFNKITPTPPKTELDNISEEEFPLLCSGDTLIC